LINRAKGWINWLLLPATALYATRLIREESISAILSVAYATYFLPAAMAARWTNVPLVLIVHDEWVPVVAHAFRAPQWPFRRMYRWAIRQASHVFVVSAGMQEMLKAEYGVDSEIQMPATEAWDQAPLPSTAEKNRALRILYVGNLWAARDSLDLLFRLIREKSLRRYGLEAVELHLCTSWSIDADPDIKQHGWVSESETRQQIAAADILFLPYSFAAEDQYVTRTSFPAKAADYIASGKAILVLGPSDSTISRYATEFGCAEVVTELSEKAVAEAICRLASDGPHRQNLALNAQRAFAINHDISRQLERLCEVLGRLVSDRQTGSKPV
jgi:glycosyltransferase involved in cell wall biosynthesis